MPTEVSSLFSIPIKEVQAMTKNEALQDLKKELHVSHSQIFTYLNCSLKYRFMYVEARPPERVSIALPFGKSIHASLERQYRVMKESQRWEPLGVLLNYFEHHINLELDQTDVPIVYKKETPDRDAVIDMGNAMLEAFHEGVNLSGFEILEIERPLSARLYTDEGQPTDLKLIGVLDLVLKDEAGRIIAVDNKTAAKPYAQATVDDDNQLTCYAYLLAANRYVFPTADVHCRFDVLRKLKSPKLEQYHTVRTADQRRRFAKLATAVLAAIDQKVFFPQPSWMCSDCAYQDACRSW
jgi:putative RecB family exonuclease